jgi:hypothetical protein
MKATLLYGAGAFVGGHGVNTLAERGFWGYGAGPKGHEYPRA